MKLLGGSEESGRAEGHDGGDGGYFELAAEGKREGENMRLFVFSL
jgi:hypothetical protein